MTNNQLLDYIKKSIETGSTKEQISAALLQQGWQQQDIDEAMGPRQGSSRTAAVASTNKVKLDDELAKGIVFAVDLILVGLYSNLLIGNFSDSTVGGAIVLGFLFYYLTPLAIILFLGSIFIIKKQVLLTIPAGIILSIAWNYFSR